MNVLELVLLGADVLGKGEILKQEIDPVVRDIVTVASRVAKETQVDVSDILTADPVFNRTMIAGAALEAEMNAVTDWSKVGDEAFEIAKGVLKVVGLGVALFGV